MILSVRQAIELEIPPHFTHNTGSKWGQTHDMPFGVIGGFIAGIGSAIGASVTAGVAAGAAIAGGAAVTAAGVSAIVGAVATVATIAGLGLTVIGLATGNKTLTKIGGYIGIAGGIAGIAAGAVSFAAGVGAEAASAGAGAAVTTPLAEQAAAPVMTQIGTNIGQQTTAEAAKQAVVQASTQVADKGSWFGNLFDDIGTGIASNYDKTVTALGNAGTDTLAGAAGKVTNAPAIAPTTSTVTPPIAPAAAKSSSFFGNLFSGDNLKNVLEVGKMGFGVMQGSAKEEIENQQLNTIMAQKYADLGQQQYQFNKNFAYKEQQDAIQRANKNSIANLDFETRQATPEEKDAYEKEKAQKSRAMAEALVTPAPLAPGAR